jgi:hypothetical protein
VTDKKQAILSHASLTSNYPPGASNEWIEMAKTIIEKTISDMYTLKVEGPSRYGRLWIEGDDEGLEAGEIMGVAWEDVWEFLPAPTRSARANNMAEEAARQRDEAARKSKYKIKKGYAS